MDTDSPYYSDDSMLGRAKWWRGMAESMTREKCSDDWWDARYGDYPERWMAATWFYKTKSGEFVVGDNYGPYWESKAS